MPFLDPILNNGYMLAVLSPLLKRAPKVVVETSPAALSPLTYLPFHLVGAHLTARMLPHKHITYPVQMAFGVTQFVVEHYSAEVPSVAAFGPLLVGLLLLQAPYVYYRAFKYTEGTKAYVWAALATFPLILFFFKGLELGFPKDTPEEQAEANLDRTHSLWHLLLHCVLFLNQLAVSKGMPWTPKAERAALVPPSPKHNTRRNVPSAALEVPCSPQSAKKRIGGVGNWPKAKAA